MNSAEKNLKLFIVFMLVLGVFAVLCFSFIHNISEKTKKSEKTIENMWGDTKNANLDTFPQQLELLEEAKKVWVPDGSIKGSAVIIFLVAGDGRIVGSQHESSSNPEFEGALMYKLLSVRKVSPLPARYKGDILKIKLLFNEKGVYLVQ